MYALIITLAIVAAIAATGKRLPEILLTPVTQSVQLIGFGLQEAREKIKHFIVTPEPPNLIRYVMAAAFSIGSIAWSTLDSLLVAISFKIIVSENALKLFSMGIKPIDNYIAHYLYSAISIVLVVMLSVMIHYIFTYIAQKHPQSIEAVTSLSVVLAVVGLIVTLAFMRYFSTINLAEMNRAIETHNYTLSTVLTSKAGILSMVFFILGILSAGLCAFLGLNPFLHQTAQMCAVIILVPITVMMYIFIILSEIMKGLQSIVAIPVSVIDETVQFIKHLLKKKDASYKVLSVLLLAASCLSLQGCSISETRPRLVVAVIDLSASFIPERENTITKVTDLIDNLESEDQFYCLFIDDQSFSDMRLIYLPPENTDADIKAKLDYLKSMDSVKNYIADIVNTPPANRTDILGSFQRTQGIFEQNGKGCDKYLVVFSDMDDNVNAKSGQLSLDSVRVLVVFAGTNKQDFNSAADNIEHWRQIFQNSKAKSVEIYGNDLSMSLDIKQYLEGGK